VMVEEGVPLCYGLYNGLDIGCRNCKWSGDCYEFTNLISEERSDDSAMGMNENVKLYAIVGFDESRSGEENYFLCDGIADDVQVQPAIDYLKSKMNTRRGGD